MLAIALLSSVLVISAYGYPRFWSSQTVLENDKFSQLDHDPICVQIEQATSSGTHVVYPGERAYNEDIFHWATSGIQRSKCSVRPDTVENIAIILRILGKTRTPFATAIVGSGLVWDDVYAALAPHRVNVVGGRESGVGVAGFTLGGGISYLTNQHRLAVDNVIAYDLVQPTRDIVTVTDTSYPDIFFGLKGGGNNFGIVTRFTFKTFPQGRVWGGSILYDFSQIAAVKSATLAYSESVIDPKAALITSYITTEYGKIAAWHLDAHFFYDGSIPPVVIFDDFLAIPYIEKNVFSRDFLSLVQSFPAGDEFGRAIYNGTPILGYTSKILDAIANETVFWSDHLKRFGVTYVDYGVQPFLPTAFDRGVHGSSAYPPSQNSVCPFHLYFAWSDVRFDEIFHEAARQSAAHLAGVAAAEGQDVATAAIYPNYAMFDTPLEAMYGGNLHALRTLQKFVDPEDVMGLAGGFKF